MFIRLKCVLNDKRIMKINYLLLFGAILCSCARVDDHPGVREHIVSQFLNVSSIELRYNEYEENNGLFYIGSNGDYADNETRERLWKEYDDYHYNKVQVEPLHVSMNDFIKIDVTSDRDFNNIPAGASLATKVRLIAVSPKKWLMSGGARTYSWDQMPSDYTKFGNRHFQIPEVFPVNGLLSEITSEDLKLLIVSHICFYFIETPAIKEHKITVTFYEKEKSISSSVKYVFQ